MNQENTQTHSEVPKQDLPKPANDSGTIEVNAHFKIFDPNTKEVFVEDRG
jgi:hypothetical protein